MVIDIVILVFLIVFGVWGARRGLVKQIALLAAIVLMYFFASPIAEIFTAIVKDHSSLSIPERYIHTLLVSLSATAIFVVVNLLGGFLHKTLIQGIKPLENANKAFGFTLGVISCALVCYFVLCLANCAMGWIESYAPALSTEFKESVAFASTKQYNLIEEQMPEIAKKTGKYADKNKVSQTVSDNEALETLDPSPKENKLQK